MKDARSIETGPQHDPQTIQTNEQPLVNNVADAPEEPPPKYGKNLL
jgi:hypothetical protein